MEISVHGEPKEIASLVLALQERPQNVVNNLVLDTVSKASTVENGTFGDSMSTLKNPEDVNLPTTADEI